MSAYIEMHSVVYKGEICMLYVAVGGEITMKCEAVEIVKIEMGRNEEAKRRKSPL